MANCEWEAGDLNEYLGGLYARAYEQKIPIKGVFELTPRCNFNCNMCYVHLQPDQIPALGREMTTEEWLDMGRQAQRAGTLDLTLTGGEPFVRPDFQQLYEAFHDMGFLIQIFSNGSLMDSQTVRWLKRRPPKAVRFTLYGASDETYRAVCGARDGFSQVVRSIERLKEARLPLYLVATVTRENVRELDEMYRCARQYNLPMIHTDSLVPPVRGAQTDAKAHEAQRVLPPPDVIRRIRARDTGRFPRKPGRDFLSVCGNYRKGYWVSWSGRMQLCAFLPQPSVSVREASFADCWARLLALVQELRQPQECAACPYETYCERCPGILYAEAGSAGKIAPAVCAKARYCYRLYGEPLPDVED